VNNDIARHNHPPEARPLDWDDAVGAAKARLNEPDVLPDTASDPVLADAIEWLAAMLCAYGKLADEVDRMQARVDQLPVGKRPIRRHRNARVVLGPLAEWLFTPPTCENLSNA